MMNRISIDSPPPASSGMSAPPRLLFWGAGLLLLAIIGAAVGAVIYITGGRRIGALIPYALFLAVLVPLLIMIAGVVLRNQLPRRFLLWAVLVIGFLGIAGAIGGIIFYRDVLPPRYQEELFQQAPFLRALLPPTPSGGVIPTAAITGGGISPEELLGLTVATRTPTDATSATPVPTRALTQNSVIEVTEALSAPSTVTPPTLTSTLAPTSLPTQAATLLPTLAPTVLPTEAAMVSTPQAQTVAQSYTDPVISLPVTGRMYGFRPVTQGWNNCGPANVTQALSFFGWTEDQSFAQQFLRPNDEDKNVSPHEIVAFVNEQSQVRALSRIGGTMDLLKAFIAANFPILVETVLDAEGYGWTGHYQTVVAYDDTQSVFYVYDTYTGIGGQGEGIAERYDEFDANWQAMNRVFVVLYRPGDEAQVRAILGERADTTRAAELALETAQAEAIADRQNAFAWFNMGSSYNRLGMYEEAASAYDQAVQLNLPFRMNWYQFGMFEAYFHQGRYTDVISIVEANLTNGAQYVEETYYWQGMVFAEQGLTAEAAAAFQRALTHNPRYTLAQQALDALNA